MSNQSRCKIRVMPPCKCYARYWFDCRCIGESCEYVAEGHPWEIEETGIPTPEFVKYVAQLHPGSRLIFIPGPSYLADKYQAALEGTL